MNRLPETPVARGWGGSPALPRRVRAGWLCGALAVLLPGARAEVSWMQPERFSATPGAILVVEMTTAPEFGDPASPVAPDKLAQVNSLLGGQPLMQTAPVTSASMLQFAVTLPRPGVAVMLADLKPERREIPRDSVEAYLRQIHATDDVRDAWAEATKLTAWRERRWLRLRSYVRVGEPSADEKPWLKPAPAGLDVVPEKDPTSFHENDQVVVRVVRDGAPLPGLIVSFLSRGENREHVVVTDANGRAAAPVDATGPWLIQSWSVRRSDGGDGEWNVESVAMVLEVR